LYFETPEVDLVDDSRLASISSGLLYCEFCVRNYLKVNFLNWTSKNNDIDNL
jgi:hypothetical protein